MCDRRQCLCNTGPLRGHILYCSRPIMAVALKNLLPDGEYTSPVRRHRVAKVHRSRPGAIGFDHVQQPFGPHARPDDAPAFQGATGPGFAAIDHVGLYLRPSSLSSLAAKAACGVGTTRYSDDQTVLPLPCSRTDGPPGPLLLRTHSLSAAVNSRGQDAAMPGAPRSAAAEIPGLAKTCRKVGHVARFDSLEAGPSSYVRGFRRRRSHPVTLLA